MTMDVSALDTTGIPAGRPGARVRSHVLLVDDDPDVTAMLSNWLRQFEFTTSVASDGEAALDAALRRDPRLVLLDLGLPRVDGFEVLKRMKSHARLRHVPVVVLTGDRERSHRVRAERLGASAFVHKWEASWELLRVVRRAMESRSGQRRSL